MVLVNVLREEGKAGRKTFSVRVYGHNGTCLIVGRFTSIVLRSPN